MNKKQKNNIVHDFMFEMHNGGYHEVIGYDQNPKRWNRFELKRNKIKNKGIAETYDRRIKYQLYKEFIRRFRFNNINEYWMKIDSDVDYATSESYVDEKGIYVVLTIFCIYKLGVDISKHNINRLKITDPDFYSFLSNENKRERIIDQEHPSIQSIINKIC